MSTTPDPKQDNLVECHACGNRVQPVDGTCPICGFPIKLPSAAPITKRSDLPLPEGEEPPPARERGSAAFDLTTSLILHVQPNDNFLTLTVRKPTILGRGVGTRTLDPEELVDLTELGAYRYGVSRHHCQFERHNNELHLKDLGSSNGTFLNDRKLAPHKGAIVCDGDQIRLGALSIAVTFSLKT